MRIIDRLNIGGPAKHVIWLTARLDPSQFESVLITGAVAPGEGDMSYFARAAGITPVVIGEMGRELGMRDIVVIAKLVYQLWRIKPHIVHTHKSKAGAAGRIAAIIYRWATVSALWLSPRPCRIVHTYHGHTFHGYYGPAKTRLFIGIEQALAHVTDRILAISERQRSEILERFRVGRKSQFRVVPLGTDLAVEPPQRGCLRRQIGASDDEAVVGIVGRLTEVKNHAMFLEAAAAMVGPKCEPRLNARFVIIGDGHLRGELERLSRRLGIEDRVFFTGFREDVMSLYFDLDLVVLTSLNEGTPLTLIEALACGRAVAATEVGGIADLMGAHQGSLWGFSIWDNGVSVPGGDAETFARAVEFLIQRPDLRRQMGERGRAFVTSRLSIERLISDISELYQDLMRVEAVPPPAAEAAVKSQ